MQVEARADRQRRALMRNAGLQLSQVCDAASMNIVRDGEFRSLGLLSHDGEAMLVGLYDSDYLNMLLKNSRIACVITTPSLARELPKQFAVTTCDHPKSAFYRIHSHLFHETDFYWSDFDSEVSPEAIIHPRAYVAPRNVRIGRGTIIEPNATILERSIIGEDVVIRAGAVVGAEGFEPKHLEGRRVIIPHAGGVLIHDRVEIQANSHIARSVFGGFTEVGEDTKIDALVHIAHNVRIGRRCEIAACAMLAGSAVVGDDVFIGPNASVSSERRIGDQAVITLGAVVTKDVPSGQKVSGNFAIEHSRFIRFVKSIR